MANKKNEITVSFAAEDMKRLDDYTERNKFKTTRAAVLHLLTEAEKMEGIDGKNEGVEMAVVEKGAEGKKGRGRPAKGKKAEEPMASPQGGDMEVVNESDSENDELGGVKASQAHTKKANPKKVAKKPVMELDGTFDVKDQAKAEPPKKAGKGKKVDVEVEIKNSGDVGEDEQLGAATFQSPKANAGETKSQSPMKKHDAGDTKSPKTKADGQDLPEAKKQRRGGKAAATVEENDQETVVPAPSRGKGMKKTASVSDVAAGIHVLAVDAEEPAAGEGKGRGGGKRKKNEKKDDVAAAASASQPEMGASAAVKPKRGRNLPKKNYDEKKDESD